jgi:hypothetical protein
VEVEVLQAADHEAGDVPVPDVGELDVAGRIQQRLDGAGGFTAPLISGMTAGRSR